MSMLESDSLPPPSPSSSSSNNELYIELRDRSGRPDRPVLGLVPELVLLRERGGDNKLAEDVLRGRGVLERMVSMSGLSDLAGCDGGDELLTSTLCFLAFECRMGFFQGRVCESRRDGSLALVRDRFLALPKTAPGMLGEVISSENSSTISSNWAESSGSKETIVSVFDISERGKVNSSHELMTPPGELRNKMNE